MDFHLHALTLLSPEVMMSNVLISKPVRPITSFSNHFFDTLIQCWVWPKAEMFDILLNPATMRILLQLKLSFLSRIIGEKIMGKFISTAFPVPFLECLPCRTDKILCPRASLILLLFWCALTLLDFRNCETGCTWLENCSMGCCWQIIDYLTFKPNLNTRWSILLRFCM